MNDAWLQFAHVGMHPDRARTLLEHAGSPATVVTAIRKGAVTVPAHARAAAAVPASERRARLAEADITLVIRGDSAYPTPLEHLPDAPPFLFQRGAPGIGRALAVVGTRTCTSYGIRMATAYGRAASMAGWRVVSGLARGIDGAAHRGSLDGPTPGIAVLGSGIDVWYPAEHRTLGAALLESGGTVWSEAPPGTPPTGWRFPPRNRIISGVAEAVIVVEAGTRGGALITARTALDQGKDVLATPGDVERPSSTGCNLLIRDGAIPVHDPDDLLETLELLLGNPLHARVAGESGPVVAVDEYLASLGLSDTREALAEMGRRQAAGAITVRDGLVREAMRGSGATDIGEDLGKGG